MKLTASELTIYVGLQETLDKNHQDQTLRLILADWYEERGREAAAECMRWLVAHDTWPWGESEWKYGWGWTCKGNIHKTMYVNHKLPDEVFELLPRYKGGHHHGVSKPKWWEWCRSRQFAEEAAVMAWEKWWQVR